MVSAIAGLVCNSFAKAECAAKLTGRGFPKAHIELWGGVLCVSILSSRPPESSPYLPPAPQTRLTGSSPIGRSTRPQKPWRWPWFATSHGQKITVGQVMPPWPPRSENPPATFNDPSASSRGPVGSAANAPTRFPTADGSGCSGEAPARSRIQPRRASPPQRRRAAKES